MEISRKIQLKNANAQLILHVNIALKKARKIIYVKVAILNKAIIQKVMMKMTFLHLLNVIMKKQYSVFIIII